MISNLNIMKKEKGNEGYINIPEELDCKPEEIIIKEVLYKCGGLHPPCM